MYSDRNKLRDAVIAAFDESVVPNNRIRLAWQAMYYCNSLPLNDRKCIGSDYSNVKGSNHLQIFDANARENLKNWITKGMAAMPTGGQGTPSQRVMNNVHNYMKSSASLETSPWYIPSLPTDYDDDYDESKLHPLIRALPVKDRRNAEAIIKNQHTCRRNYHIFMTDGAWRDDTLYSDSLNAGNASWSLNDHTLLTVTEDTESGSGGQTTANIDNARRILPDGAIYDPQQPWARIYKDNWGFHEINAKRQTRTSTYASWSSSTDVKISGGMNTLSDLVFNQWATDYDGDSNNNRRLPRYDITSDELISDAQGRSYLMPEYWNPKNDPSSWQGISTYTIGFGEAAEIIKSEKKAHATLLSDAPEFALNNASPDNSMFDSPGYADLILGNKAWPSPFCGKSDQTRNTPCTSLTDEWERSGNTRYSIPGFDRTYNRNSSLNSGGYVDGARKFELWHMAINGRGRYFPVPAGSNSSKALEDAFKKILGDVLSENRVKQDTTSFSFNSTLMLDDKLVQFVSAYKSDTWSGKIYSNSIDASGQLTANPGWGVNANKTGDEYYKSTADLLDAMTLTQRMARPIFTTVSSTSRSTISNFNWTALKDTNFGLSEKLVNYIRGDQSEENKGTFRERNSIHGDISGSKIWYTGSPTEDYKEKSYINFKKDLASRDAMLYVGANDGMLHGFSATNGAEKFAYVPHGVLKKLDKFSQKSFNTNHKSFVDGSPFTADVNLAEGSSTPNWQTLLFGSLGSGGRGYFILNVTDPNNIKRENLGFLDNTLAYDVTTASGDANDLGHIFHSTVEKDGNPYASTQVTKMNNGQWAYITGNGYNSINERPVLFIQYLSGSKSTKTIPVSATTMVGKGNGNGLSAPRILDLDGNGTADIVYAGDLKGNLWKFDLTATSDSNWGVTCSKTSTCERTPLFVAKYTKSNSSTPQPITNAPIAHPHTGKLRGLQIAFGTGRNLTEPDRLDDEAINTFYSFVDTTLYAMTTDSNGKSHISAVEGTTHMYTDADRNRLVEQKIIDPDAAYVDQEDSSFWSASNNDVNYDPTSATAPKGWFMHFPKAGERLMNAPSLYDSSNNLLIYSQIPKSGGHASTETCEPPARNGAQYATFINLINGKQPSIQVLRPNIPADETWRSVSRIELPIGPVSPPIKNGNKYTHFSGDKKFETSEMPTKIIRANWRQIN